MRDGRLVVCALACAGAMVITACGGDDGGGGGGGGGSDAGGSKKVKVGFVPKSFESAFWLATKTGAEKAGDGDSNIELTVDAAASESAVEDQIAIVDNMLSKGVDALAIAPSAPDQLQPVLERAIADGVKVVVIDSDIPNLKDKTAFVGTNNEKAGQTGGAFVKKQLPKGGKVGLVDGTAGIQSLIDRVKGFKQAIGGSGIEVVQTVRAEGCTRDHGVSAVEDLLTAHDDLDGIFTACGEPAVGGLQAVKGAGLKPDDLVYVGFDATKDELTAIEGGDEDGSVAQFPEKMGEEAVKAAAAAARGETVGQVIDTGSEVVTKDNVAQFK
jgi:simple sugar transport system substrate-binding protein